MPASERFTTHELADVVVRPFLAERSIGHDPGEAACFSTAVQTSQASWTPLTRI